MQDKLMISIIDDNGSRQFSVHHLVQKIALIAGVGTLAIVVLYFIAAHFLMSELEVILANNTQVRENFQSIYEKNSELERNIDYKTNEFLKISSKINELENIVNVHQRNHETYHHQDIDLDSLTPLQKDMILKIIPNGNPVDDFASKNFPSKSASIYTLVQGTPVYATANGIIDSVRVAGGENHLVKIQHSYGFTSSYGHLGKVVVQKGDFVTKGQVIGYSGANASLYYDLHFIDSALPVANYTDWNNENFTQVIDVNNAIDWKSLVWALDDIIQLKNYRVSYQGEDHLRAY
ncbi:M23 family metallopeptidase [uncultured Helicobacter sp.]|uniref:M23 family metallopeptidase n=1 Tax=uncultured Helicobacter sp. TaxID=175537 RepID=UPI0026036B32|nr:M23 family metallopeptidase [uncultured Helicobacter sp.]